MDRASIYRSSRLRPSSKIAIFKVVFSRLIFSFAIVTSLASREAASVIANGARNRIQLSDGWSVGPGRSPLSAAASVARK
jgi:hypothetical protein